MPDVIVGAGRAIGRANEDCNPPADACGAAAATDAVILTAAIEITRRIRFVFIADWGFQELNRPEAAKLLIATAATK